MKNKRITGFLDRRIADLENLRRSNREGEPTPAKARLDTITWARLDELELIQAFIKQLIAEDQ
jgi:hypothetical protein